MVIWVSLAAAASLGIAVASRSGLYGAAPDGVARGVIAASRAAARQVESA
ncbi:hypothetical protein [Arthrobacter bambusae]|nr:hypothetical protein [Arthrobacter bambusae]MDQ0031872.1 hypothetical protein [Arthrobacter bambusae]MDQ0100011.1 hypothetical protein [Arthrobacter bambusae]